MTDRVKIEWVNHSSYVLDYKDTRLIVDPWLFGSCFDEGWSLLADSKFTIDDFESITHIWFSHEHPDHFSPWILTKIPLEFRKKITILFQETLDKRIVKFCKKLSFNVTELPNKLKYNLVGDLSITCGKMINIDSWLLYETSDLKILNLNDCVIDSLTLCESIKKTTGTVDVLLTQFSYANWEGNPEDVERRNGAAKEKLERVGLQTKTFKPKYTIPFASYIYFSHEENKYMNDMINTVDTVHNYISEKTQSNSLIFYPGDTWDFNSNYCSDNSLRRYRKEYNSLDGKFFTETGTPLTKTHLLNSGQKYLKDIRKNNSYILMKALPMLPKRFGFKKIIIKLMDTGEYCSFCWLHGFEFIKNDGLSVFDVELSTRSLNQVFKFQWGAGTVLINARYRASAVGHKNFYRIFMLGMWNSMDRRLSFISILKSILMRLIFRKNISAEDEFSFYKSWGVNKYGRCNYPRNSNHG